MITLKFRKKMTDSWFSYLQSQICKEFEYIENNKTIAPVNITSDVLNILKNDDKWLASVWDNYLKSTGDS